MWCHLSKYCVPKCFAASEGFFLCALNCAVNQILSLLQSWTETCSCFSSAGIQRLRLVRSTFPLLPLKFVWQQGFVSVARYEDRRSQKSHSCDWSAALSYCYGVLQLNIFTLLVNLWWMPPLDRLPHSELNKNQLSEMVFVSLEDKN